MFFRYGRLFLLTSEIVSLTRNRFVGDEPARGFESHLLRHVVADFVSFATTISFSKQSSSLIHSVAPPLRIEPACPQEALRIRKAATAAQAPDFDSVFRCMAMPISIVSRFYTLPRTIERSRRLFSEKSPLPHFVAAPFQKRALVWQVRVFIGSVPRCRF